MPRRRVTFVAPFGLARKGTTRARVLPLARAVAAQGARVRVLVPSWDVAAERGQRYHLGEACVVHLPMRQRRGAAALGQIGLEALQRVLVDEPDVVHCFKPIGYAGAAALWLRAAQRRGRWCGLLAMDTDDLEGPDGWGALGGYPRWQRVVRGWQERAGLRAAGLVSAASQELVRQVEEWNGAHLPVVYLPNAGTPPAESAPRDPAMPADACMLLLYTRFNEFEPRRVVPILDAIFRSLPAARLCVVGDTASARGRDFLATLAARGWSARVHDAGPQYGAARDVLLRYATVALWPFDDTALNRARSPAKLLDLLWLGKAVVAEAVGEVPALAGSAARLVPANRVDLFVEEAVRLLTSPAERAALERAARAHAERTASWAQRAAALCMAYERVRGG